MKKHYLFTILLICIVSFGARSQQVAFPGAEGFGKYSLGGRTGTVYHVTNLNDSGEGSFREAVSSPNRIVVFDVAGVIRITSAISVDSNIYIAGQTAPGEGITIYGNRVTFTEAHNCICRFIRFRMGVVGSSGKDACGLASGKNMIFDHISVSWGRDENFSINWDQKGVEPTNITLQNSIISQGLLTHSAGGLIQTNGGVTLYRNLYVDNTTRNNKVKGVNQYVNNIVYNWSSAAYIMGGGSEGESFVNVESNYFIMGPDLGDTPIRDGNENFHIYATDNWFDNSLDEVLNGYEIPFGEYSGTPDFQDTPYDYPELPEFAASELFDNIIPTVGAYLPYRDYADYYVINEVKSLGAKGGFISDESILPFGAPSSWSLWAGTSRIDTDEDGMPDDWEDANGTDINVDDAMVIASNDYANIENYINGITQEHSQEYLRIPLNFTAQPASVNSISFSWLDYTSNEDGFILERYIDGSFQAVDTVGANLETMVLSGLQPEETDTFRLRAYNSFLSSPCTEGIIARSNPVVIEAIDPDTFVPDLTWKGQSNSNWDKSSINWLSETNSVSFTDGAKVLFDDALSKDQNLSIVEGVSIDAMFVKSDFNYTFSGAGVISGTGSVNKTGSGELVLETENTYSGPTVIWDGTVNVNKLADGGLPSSIGASSNYNFNLVFKGGKLNYTGGSVSTDRCILLDGAGELSVESENTSLTMSSGTLSGIGALNKSGKGTLALINGIGNTYEGETTLSEGTLSIDLNLLTELENVLGTSEVVNFQGGDLKIVNGQSSSYETYDFSMNIPEGETGGFLPYRNCSIACKVAGGGVLNYTIPYVREYITGDWSEFTGIVNVIQGGNTSEGSQFLLNNSVGLPSTRVNLLGEAKVVCWKNAGTMSFGGLSGEPGSFLAGADKKNNAATMTWIVGGANTDETFNGIINNECSSAAYKGSTSIVKEGTGIWRLTGANVYSGTTTIKAGKLIVNGKHSGTGIVSVEDGATLAGTGVLPDSVNVFSGGVVEPGDSNIDTLTVGHLKLNSGCQVNVDIDKNSGMNDVIVTTDSVFLNGILNLTISGALEVDDEFTIFSSVGFADSTFDEIRPSVPAENMAWEFNKGILRVVEVEVPLPPVSNIVEAASGLDVSVMPNPVFNNLSVELSKNYEKIDVKVISLVGAELITTTRNNCSSVNVDFSNQSKGIYFIVIIADGEKLSVEKVIKE